MTMTPFEQYSLTLSILTFLIALIGLVYVGIQLKASYRIHSANHDWNRRMAAQSALKEYSQSILISGLQTEFNYLNRIEAIPLSDITAGFNNHPNLQNELHQLLNFYEGLARGVFHRIYDENVIKSGRRGAMTRASRAFDAYMKNRRATLSPNAWSNMDALVAKWIHEEKSQQARPPTDAQP